MRLSSVPWGKDRLPNCHFVMGVITKIKMARDWLIGVVFLLHLVGVRESAFVERWSSYGNCGARQCENGDDKFCMKQVDESQLFSLKRGRS